MPEGAIVRPLMPLNVFVNGCVYMYICIYIYIYIYDYKVMDMKQTSNCTGLNVTFRPSSDVELYLFTGKKVKKI